MHASLGMVAEWCRVSALRQAERETKDRLDRNAVTRYIYSHAEKFNLRLLPLPAPIDRDDVRFVLEVEEDWENAQEIVEALGIHYLDWQHIARLLDAHPDMRRRMATLNRQLASTN